ncbi:L-amino acid N-acyltransferase YncA [Stella humosa]|uniref:L-amino acid N-acyltransferase YncA n=1 Tax=Stella humosa TaxID=94 RepID=A0A3N1KYW9_9PROT|nr:GNAT family N-acetyltransferase [Stella humosa]ROP83518.1 L-amino acid N-acyltransferase YncA [Stella humosa]BBK33209.1 hypothetical protein STHU_38430 [Stella humosa]
MNAPPIRRAAHADIPRLFEIRFAVTENRLIDPTRVTAADCAWFIDHSDVWVWVEDGTIRGFSAADPRDATIWALFVEPGQDGRGIGRALLAVACDTLRRHRFRSASLTTDAGSRAEGFYRAAGWVEIGRDGGEVRLQLALRSVDDPVGI